jgi:hypothetical protein
VCEQTRFGPRFIGDEFETLVYPIENGTVQTRLAFWQRVLQTRVSDTESAEISTSGVSASGAY